MKGSTIENHVSGFFIKSSTFIQRFIIKLVGVFGVMSPYLASHVLNLIMHSTHNSLESSHIFLSSSSLFFLFFLFLSSLFPFFSSLFSSLLSFFSPLFPFFSSLFLTHESLLSHLWEIKGNCSLKHVDICHMRDKCLATCEKGTSPYACGTHA